MSKPTDRIRLAALCEAARDSAAAVTVQPLPFAQTIASASLCRIHADRLAGAIADPSLAEVAHLAVACAEYLENALAVQAERARARA